jgi:hypothetical protein
MISRHLLPFSSIAALRCCRLPALERVADSVNGRRDFDQFIHVSFESKTKNNIINNMDRFVYWNDAIDKIKSR